MQAGAILQNPITARSLFRCRPAVHLRLLARGGRMERLTSTRIRQMTDAEITAYWIARQCAKRDEGRPHTTVLRNSDRRGEIVATIDGRG